MLKSRRSDILTALVLVAPFVVVYGVLFVWPTIQMVALTFTKSPLIGWGEWVGFKNYERLWNDRLFWTATWNTLYFVLLTVVPSTLLGLAIALGVNRLSGWMQSMILAAFFLPNILPVSVVYRIWNWLVDAQFGIAQIPIEAIWGEAIPITRTIPLFMPFVALVTIWWTVGFNVLLFIAGLRNISAEVYEAAALDGATRWQLFRRITWPLIWPVTALVATIQLILQLKIFDQVYLFSTGGRPNDNLVMVYYIFQRAFQSDQGGRAAAIAVVLFAMVVVVSVLNFQLVRLSRGRAG